MRIRKIFPLLLAGVIGTAAPMTTYAATTEEQIADAQAQKEAAQTQLAQQQANMDSLESKKQELESYLGELNAQYDELTSSISDLSIQAAEKEEELKSLEEKLQEAKQTSDKQYEDMKKRIVYMYENGSASMLELLLSSEDLAQFLNRAENIAQISKYDRDMLDKYKEQEDAAEEEASSINSLLAEKSAKQQEVQALTASTSENIQSYIYQISSSQEEINALNTQISNADSSIYSLLQVAAQEEAAAQAEAASSEGDSESTASDESNSAEDSYTENSYTEDSYSEDSYGDDSSYSESGDSQDSSDSSQSSASDTSSSSGSGTYLGTFTLTAYCNCAQCCGTAGNLTASGTVPTAGRTVAMAGVPFGTQLLINGNVYTVEDLGTPYGHVDIYFNSHSEALAFGLQSAEVYRLN